MDTTYKRLSLICIFKIKVLTSSAISLAASSKRGIMSEGDLRILSVNSPSKEARSLRLTSTLYSCLHNTGWRMFTQVSFIHTHTVNYLQCNHNFCPTSFSPTPPPLITSHMCTLKTFALGRREQTRKKH